MGIITQHDQMPVSLLSLLGLGFVLGLKHALDADHLAAVSTMATDRRGLLASSLIGAWWGLGHTISLMLAGVVVILLHWEISERTSRTLEFGVGIMLILLGANALRKLARSRTLHAHAHEHDGHWHMHPHLHDHESHDGPHTHHGFKIGARPLLVGIVHGLAGSAALTLLVLATIPSPLYGFVYIATFGLGSVGGMAIMSTLFALPAKLTLGRFRKLNFLIRAVAGVFSLCFGLFMIYEIAFMDKVLR